MALELNPVAVTHAPLLRAIAASGWESQSDLARHAGRDPKNMTRDLATLRNSGLVEASDLALTEEGLAQIAALDRAANPALAAPLTAIHADLLPHPLNPRKDFDSEEAQEALDDLRVSIVKKGILQPILVRPREDAPGKWWIIAGERRWRAVAQAIWDGDWEEDRGLPITVREVDDAEHLELSLLENIQRADMLPIEEAVGIGQAIREFGADTASLADKLGKSQRWVQLRLQLLDLSPEDQDRMRLAKGHPDRLGFKAALALVQTPRPPSPTGSAGEPGSPVAKAEAASPPPFDSLISDREALILVEIADKADRDPDSDLGSEHYTRVSSADAMHGNAQGLVTKGLIGFRQRGMTVLVRPRLFSTGYGEWLTGLRFNEHRADCLFEARARVHGVERAQELQAGGGYATSWLNVRAGSDQADGGEPMGGLLCRPDPTLTQSEIDEAYAAADRRAAEIRAADEEPHQPELIEASEEEKAERERRRQEAADRVVDEQAVDWFTQQLKAKLAASRAKGRRGWSDPKLCSSEALAFDLVRHVGKGDPLDIAAYAMFVLYRAGPVYSGRLLAFASDPLGTAAPSPEAEQAYAEALERR